MNKRKIKLNITMEALAKLGLSIDIQEDHNRDILSIWLTDIGGRYPFPWIPEGAECPVKYIDAEKLFDYIAQQIDPSWKKPPLAIGQEIDLDEDKGK